VDSLVIGYVGMTHLGLNSAVAGAVLGFSVVAFHDDFEVISDLNAGITSITEPRLTENLSAHKERLTFTSDPAALHRCDVVYVSVDVPTDAQASSDLAPVIRFVNLARAHMRVDASLVVLCQVPPGFTRSIDWPESQLFYQVETLIFGRAMERALQPERFIIGVADARQPLPLGLSSYLAAFGCPVLPMRYESAELAKIAINLFLVSTVTTVNILAELCEHVGADWFDIIPALRLDKRIGAYAYLQPGLGIAGGNLERDLRTVDNLSAIYRTDAAAVKAWVVNSAYRKNWVFNKIQQFSAAQGARPVLALWGLTYKENTDSLKNSVAIDLIGRLPQLTINAYDPAAPEKLPVGGVTRVEKKFDALQGADMLAVLTPWGEFRDVSVADMQAAMRGRVVIDPYRILDGEALASYGFLYSCLGRADLGRPTK